MIKSFGGMIQVKGEGTIVWKIEDDDIIVHPNKTKKALYAPEAPSCLLAPKQWAQKTDKNYPKPDGTWCDTKARHCIFYWKQERYRRTIPWDPSIKFYIIRSAPSSNNYCVFVADYGEEHKREEIKHV